MYIKLHNSLCFMHMRAAFMADITAHLAVAIQGWPFNLNTTARIKYACA